MQANKLRPIRGWYWIVEGFGLVRRMPMAFFSSASTVAMLVLLFGFVPVIGQTALILVLPPLEIGMFLISREVAEGNRIHPALLFAGFRMKLRPLFAIGGIRLIGNLVALWLAVLISGIAGVRLVEIVESGKQLPPELLNSYLKMLALFFVIRLPVEMATWYAAPWVGLRGLTAIKALFFSFVAYWRNFWVLAVFTLSFSLLSGFLTSALLSLTAGSSMLSMVLMAFCVVFWMALYYAAFYRSACDVFGEWPHPWTHEI